MFKHHKFLRATDEDERSLSWEERVSKKYYDQLFKEYCLCDMTGFKQGRIAMRWRTKDEVLSGKGQSECGNLNCSAKEVELKSWEVNFAYMEDGQKKNALVKLNLCQDCSYKLHYKKIKDKIVAEKKERKRRKKEDTKKKKKRARKTLDDTESSRKPAGKSQGEHQDSDSYESSSEHEIDESLRKESSKMWTENKTVL